MKESFVGGFRGTGRAGSWGFLAASLLLLWAAPATASGVGDAVGGVDRAWHVEDEIRGQATDVEGRPLVGAVVSVVGTSLATLTDRSGNFRISGVRAGTYRVRVSVIGFRDGEVEVTVAPGAGPVTVSLERAPLELAPVVVTANPTEAATAFQPAQVLRGEELQRLTAPSLGEIVDWQPGISARSMGPSPARPVIRGFDGERVVVLENGERMGDTQERAPDDAVSLDPLAIDRIEIVRGPASLLYGSSALGGVVNLFTRDIPDVWAPGVSGIVAVDGASVNSMLAGSGRVVYGGERWGFTGRTSYRSGDDASTPTGVLPNSGLSTVAAAGGFGYQSGTFRGGASIGYHSQEYGVPEFAVAADGPPNLFVEVEPDDEISIRRISLQSRGAWAPGRWVRAVEFRTNAHVSEQEEGDDDGDTEEVEQLINTRTFGSTLLVRHGPVAALSDGAVGLAFRYQHQEIEGLEAYHPGQRLLSLGTFFFEEVPLRHGVRLQFGGRVENEWVRTLPNEQFGPETTGDATALNLSGSVGLNVQPAEGMELGLQIARAHRNPTVVERFASGWDVGASRVEIGDPDLHSEIGHGVDVFGRFGSARARLELAAFGYWIDDFVALRVLPPDCGGIDYRVRPDREFPQCVQYFSADAEMVGAEGSVEVMITPGLRARGSADFVRGTRTDAGREPLAFVPPARFSLGVTNDAGAWLVGATARFVAPQRRVSADELPTDGYALVNLEFAYRVTSVGRHAVVVRVDNALNTAYSDHLSVVRRYPEPVHPENVARSEMPGRNVNVAYRYTF